MHIFSVRNSMVNIPSCQSKLSLMLSKTEFGKQISRKSPKNFPYIKFRTLHNSFNFLSASSMSRDAFLINCDKSCTSNILQKIFVAQC